jgi:lipopolysaccharide export system permease protein
MPDVFSIALPIALLIAVYRVMLRSREDRELIVLAGIGVSTRQFILVIVAIGFAAQLCSLAMSGFVQPRAQFLARATQFKLTYEALRGGNASARFLQLPTEVVYVPARTGEGRERPLFVQTHRDGQPTRAFSSEQARWIGPHFNNVFTLSLSDATIVDFAREPSEGPSAQLSVANTARVRLFEQDIDMTRLLPFVPRGQNPAEWTSGELLGAQAPPGGWSTEHVRETGLRFARGLLSLIAPLLAGLALIFTSRGTQAFALPATCGVLMALDIAAATLVKWVAAAGFSSLTICAGMTLVTAVIMAFLAYFLLKRHHQLISPALARA